jgi:nascent polypeptide-associated complex subunit alpha
MFKGIDNRKMKRMMQQMGIKAEEVETTEVIIKTREGELVFSHPQVTKTDLMGQKTFQIIGAYSVRKGSFSSEDVRLVCEQAGVDEEKARHALEESGGDIAAAILKLAPK